MTTTPKLLHRDPDLEALIADLNTPGAEPKPEPGETPAPIFAFDRPGGDRSALDALLAGAVAAGATDLHLATGSPPLLRIGGSLKPIADQPPLTEGELRDLVAPLLGAREIRLFDERGAVDLALSVATGERFRLNLHRQRGGLAAALRVLPAGIPSFDDLGLPVSLKELAQVQRGLVLVCGPTGSGKTTTLAAIVDEINRTRSCHVITIEDPIEYHHPHRRALVEQIEIGSDSPSFADALRAAMRQDPDVILLGEMRDLESVSFALSAAETGHLVLSSLHTNDVAQAFNRIVDVFPSGQQRQVRQQLALAFHAFVGQQLVPRRDGSGRVPAVELLRGTIAVRQHIRKETLHNLYNEIVLGRRQGMISFEESLAALVGAGTIDVEEARLRATHPDELESLLRA